MASTLLLLGQVGRVAAVNYARRRVRVQFYDEQTCELRDYWLDACTLKKADTLRSRGRLVDAVSSPGELLVRFGS